MRNDLKIIVASGSPYEIGYEHGCQGKEEVLCSIETYKSMFKTYANLDWEEAKFRSRNYVEPINKYDPDLMEEIRGVADGAGVTLEDILALNARSEVVMMGGSAIPSDGCTAMAVTPEVTKERNTILAQNWDWKGNQIKSLLVLKIHQKNKPSITMVTEGGIIGKIGFNDAGIGVCLNALGTAGNPKGLPLHVILRGILNSCTISDAIQSINRVANACAANYLIASSCGEAIDVEKSPSDFDVIYPYHGIMVHTNHYQTPRLRPADTTRFMAPDTFLRCGIATKMLMMEKGNITINSIKKILVNHKDYPDSICRHEYPMAAQGTQMCTVFSIVMDITAGKMELTFGNPCENSYVALD